MKLRPSFSFLALVLALAPAGFGAESAGGAAPSIAAQLDQHTLDKRTAPILKNLKLGDPAVETKVRAILEPHFQALQSWHAANDAALKSLWSEWAADRSPPKKDEAAAAQVGEKIDAVYATFHPQHEAFLSGLGAVLTPAQVDTVKDTLTKSPGMQRTYDAYLEMVPKFNDADKTFIHEKLAMAREKAIDAISDKEKVDIFKRQKVLVQAYIDAQGYDYEKSYAAFSAKQKAAAPAATPKKE
jgi:Protein of unknown function (DUF3826)